MNPSTVGTVQYDAIIDTSKLKSGAAEAEAVVGGMGDKADRAADRFKSAGTKMSVGVTAPLALLGGYAVNEFTKLGEAVNAANVTFGAGSSKLTEFAETAATSVGLSKSAFLQASVPIGASLQNVGYSADEAASASVELTKRAADMASVFNVDVDEALAAIQSGLRGEADPLEKFGVGLSDVAVKAFALKNGIGAVDTELTAGEKAQARYGLLMEQSSKVAGDFANTSDGLANSQRISAAQAADTAAKFGESLAPAMEKVQSIIIKVLDAFNSLSPAQQTAVVAVAAVAAAIGPLVLVVGHLITAIKGIGTALTFLSAHPAILIIIAVVAVIAGLAFLVIKNWDTLKAWFASFWEFLQTAGSAALEAVKGFFQSSLDVIKNVWSSITGFFQGVWNGIVSIFSAVVGFYASVFRGAYNAVTGVFSGLFGFFQGVWNNIVGLFSGVGTTVGNAIGSTFKGVVNGVIGGAVRIINGFINTINGAVGAINKLPGVNISKIGTLGVPMLANGGIVTSPTLAMIGEGRESEAVIPLSKLDTMINGDGKGKGNVTYNIVMNGVNDPADFTRKLKLATQGRLN